VRFEPALIPIIPNDRPVDVQYKVPSSPPEEIIAVVDTPYNVIDSNQSLFAINVTSCLPGYELKRRPGGLQSCVCQDSSFSVLDCDDSRSVIFLRNGLWAGATEYPEPQLEVQVCPVPFCQCSDENHVTCDSLYYQDDPSANRQCHGLRKGDFTCTCNYACCDRD
jgi:hypothetical protein